MDKKTFCKCWSSVKAVASKKVCGEISVVCYCELTDHCGGYELILEPHCLLWASELTFLIGAIQLVPACVEFDIEKGRIRIW